MIYTTLGNSGLEVSRLCFGAMTFVGENGWRHLGDLGQKEADEFIAILIENGVNFFDTADVYSNGESERILGNALVDHRKNVIITTKVGFRMGEGPNNNGCSRRHIIEGCEQSLKRLGTDYIDLYLIHSPDPFTPLEETMSALNDLVRQGKVRYIGCSNYQAWQVMKSMYIAREAGWEKFIAYQGLLNLIQRDIEHEILPACIDQKIDLMVWSPLAGGFLTGKYRRDKPWPPDTRMAEPGKHFPFDEDNAYTAIDELDTIAQNHKASISQAALNYVLRKTGVVSIVIGARTEKQLRDNLKAMEWSLSDKEFRRLDALTAPAHLYPQWHSDTFRKDRTL